MQVVFANPPPLPHSQTPPPLSQKTELCRCQPSGMQPPMLHSSSRADLPNPCRQHMPQSCFIYFCSRFSKVVWCMFQKPHFSIHLHHAMQAVFANAPPPTPPPHPPTENWIVQMLAIKNSAPQCPTLHQELTFQIHAGSICPKAVLFIFAADFLKLFGACSRNLVF